MNLQGTRLYILAQQRHPGDGYSWNLCENHHIGQVAGRCIVTGTRPKGEWKSIEMDQYCLTGSSSRSTTDQKDIISKGCILGSASAHERESLSARTSTWALNLTCLGRESRTPHPADTSQPCTLDSCFQCQAVIKYCSGVAKAVRGNFHVGSSNYQ